MAEFYRQIFVLESVSAIKAFRYVCYEDLGTGKFAVSSAEILTSPQDDETLAYHAKSQAEHFMTEGVGRWFDTLKEAVADFAVVMEDQRN